jgi:hypothetical protein
MAHKLDSIATVRPASPAIENLLSDVNRKAIRAAAAHWAWSAPLDPARRKFDITLGNHGFDPNRAGFVDEGAVKHGAPLKKNRVIRIAASGDPCGGKPFLARARILRRRTGSCLALLGRLAKRENVIGDYT